MREALDTYIISGVQHNIPLLRTGSFHFHPYCIMFVLSPNPSVIDHPRFIDGATITTKFLEQEYPKGFPGYPMTPQVTHNLACKPTQPCPLPITDHIT